MNKQWLQEAIEEYIKNSGHYLRLHPYIKIAIETYQKSVPNTLKKERR